MAKFLVTGGAGFIGSNLVDALLASGDEVRVVDDLSSGFRYNLPEGGPSLELLTGSITDKSVVARAVQGIDYVLHHAALASVPESMHDPEKNHAINVDGTFSLLLAAREQGVKRFVLASSAAIYGEGEESPKLESLPPAPVSPYASSKLIGEDYCRQFSATGWVPCVALRYFNIFGPRQNPESDYAAVVPIFIHRFLEGRPVTIYGDGEQTRDFTYIGNVVRANLLAIEKPGAVGEAFNIGCGGSYSVRDLHRRLSEVFEVDRDPVFEPERAGDVKVSEAGIDKARELLDYEPSISFEEGLETTCAWYREHASAVREK